MSARRDRGPLHVLVGPIEGDLFGMRQWRIVRALADGLGEGFDVRSTSANLSEAAALASAFEGKGADAVVRLTRDAASHRFGVSVLRRPARLGDGLQRFSRELGIGIGDRLADGDAKVLTALTLAGLSDPHGSTSATLAMRVSAVVENLLSAIEGVDPTSLGLQQTIARLLAVAAFQRRDGVALREALDGLDVAIAEASQHRPGADLLGAGIDLLGISLLAADLDREASRVGDPASAVMCADWTVGLAASHADADASSLAFGLAGLAHLNAAAVQPDTQLRAQSLRLAIDRMDTAVRRAETTSSAALALARLGQVRALLETARAEGRSPRLSDGLDGLISLRAQFDQAGLRRETAEIDAAIGCGYLERGSIGDASAPLGAAERQFSQALERLSGHDDRRLRAFVQACLGQALFRTGERAGGVAELARSVAAFAAARELTTDHRERARLDFFVGRAHVLTAERGGDVAHLVSAVAAFGAALEATSEQGEGAVSRVDAQSGLGLALQMLGERTDDRDALAKSVEAYRAAVSLIDRKAAPLDWVQAQNRLGAGLTSIGERSNSEERLSAAVSELRIALDGVPRDVSPTHWAMTQSNLAQALRSLGVVTRNRRLVEEAVGAYRAALQVWTPARHPFHNQIVEWWIGQTMRLLSPQQAG